MTHINLNSSNQKILTDFIEKLDRSFVRPPLLPDQFKKLILNDPDFAQTVFDNILPIYYLSLSTIHWTPVEIVSLASEFLSDLPKNSKILDIGSGCGKFCLTLSYLIENEIHGIEQRIDLFNIAETIRATNNINHVKFINGNMLDIVDWDQYDVFYLYNPFQEHVTDIDLMRIDEVIDFNDKYFAQYTSEVFRRLSWAAKGTKLITFHGYAGRVPDTWKLQKSKVLYGGDLSLWEKIN